MTEQTDVSRLQPGSLARRFHDYMLSRATEDSRDGDSTEIMATQVERILNADQDDIWEADTGGAVQARDVPGLEVRIHDMRVVKSSREFTDGAPNKGYYISMNATVLGGPLNLLTRNSLKIGQEIALQTGADLIVAKVRAFEARNMLPVDAKIDGTDTASGNTVLRLVRMPERAMPGSAE